MKLLSSKKRRLLRTLRSSSMKVLLISSKMTLWRKKRRRCRTHLMILSLIHVTKCLSIWKKQQTKLVRKIFSTNSLLTNKPQCSESFHNWSAPTLASLSIKSWRSITNQSGPLAENLTKLIIQNWPKIIKIIMNWII